MSLIRETQWRLEILRSCTWHHPNDPILVQSLISLPLTSDHSSSSIADYISALHCSAIYQRTQCKIHLGQVLCKVQCSVEQSEVFRNSIQHCIGFQIAVQNTPGSSAKYNVQFNAVKVVKQARKPQSDASSKLRCRFVQFSFSIIQFGTVQLCAVHFFQFSISTVQFSFSRVEPYLTFVTGTTGGACVKKILSGVKFYRLNAKTAYFTLLGSICCVIFWCFSIIFGCKILRFKNPAYVKEITNMRYEYSFISVQHQYSSVQL